MDEAGKSRDELGESQRGLQALLEAMEGLLFILDLEGKIIHCSSAIEDRLAFGRGELIGAHVLQLHPPDRREEVARILEGAGKVLSWRAPLMSQDCRLIPADTWVVPGQWEGKEVLYGASRDISASVETEIALKEANQQLEAALGTLPDIFFELDPQGTILDYRAPNLGQLYVEPQNFLGRTVRQVLPPEVADTIMEAVEQAIAKGRHHGVVYSLNTPEGLGWFELSIVAKGDMEGPDGRLIALARDITERVRVEQSLRVSERRYRGIFEGVRDAIFVESLTGEILDVNSRACEMFGYPREVFLTMTVPDLVPPGDTMLIPGDLPSPEVPDRPIETVNIRSDGAHIPVEITGQLQAIGDETVLLVVVRDITERKEAEAEIRRRAAQQNALNEIIAAAAGAADLPELLDMALDKTLEAMGMEMGSIWVLPHFSSRGLPRPLVDHMAQRLPSSYSGFEGVTVVEDWEYPGDSTIAHLAPHMAPHGVRSFVAVPIEGEKGYLGGISLAAPVSRSWSDEEVALLEAVGRQLGVAAERMRLLDQIQEQVRRMEQVMSTVPEGVLLLGADMEILMANARARDYLAALAGEGVEQRLTQLGGVSLAELLESTPERMWQEVGGQGRIFELVSCPLEEAGPPTGWVLVIRDVTQEREAEKWAVQQERLAAVGQMAAGIAHDFNNIMAVIVLYCQMAMRDPRLSPRARDNLDTAVKQARRATELIQQILDFSRRSVLERQQLDLLELVREQTRLLQRTLPESIRLKMSYGSDKCVVEADPTRFQQVLMNLALNARDAMPSGGELLIDLGCLEVKVAADSPLPDMDLGSWVFLAISDTGGGIAAEDLPYLFEPFFTTKAPGKGTGLGLAQVYGIVSQHGGHVGVKSELGVGSCFTVYLPALACPDRPSQASEMGTMRQGNGETILVVDDNRGVRRLLVESLTMLKYRSLEAESGAEATALFDQHRDEIALVLADLAMPEVGGREFLLELKARNPSARAIVLTGHALEEGQEWLEAAGVVGWLQKPLSLEQLAQSLAQALEQG